MNEKQWSVKYTLESEEFDLIPKFRPHVIFTCKSVFTVVHAPSVSANTHTHTHYGVGTRSFWHDVTKEKKHVIKIHTRKIRYNIHMISNLQKKKINKQNSEHVSIKSQGYDTLLAETNEKTWKQRSEQFMKRTKSESNLSCRPPSVVVTLPLSPPGFFCFCLFLLIASLRVSSSFRLSCFLIIYLICTYYIRWLNDREVTVKPSYCCVVSLVYKKSTV